MTAEAYARSSESMVNNAEQRALKEALGRYPTGVTVVTARRAEGAPIGLTVNSFTSVSLEPPLILWCLDNESPNLPAFEQAGYFGVNILAAGQQWISDRFASPVDNKFVGVGWYDGDFRVPLIEGAVAHLICRKYSRHPGGDHIILVGEVERYRHIGGDPLVYLGGDYHVARSRDGSER